MSSGPGSAIQTAVDSSDEEIVVVKRRKKWCRNNIIIIRLWISECFYEIEMLSATAWLFRGRTGLKSLLCFVIIADIITFCLYQHRDNYELVSEEVSIQWLNFTRKGPSRTIRDSWNFSSKRRRKFLTWPQKNFQSFQIIHIGDLFGHKK